MADYKVQFLNTGSVCLYADWGFETSIVLITSYSSESYQLAMSNVFLYHYHLLQIKEIPSSPYGNVTVRSP